MRGIGVLPLVLVVATAAPSASASVDSRGSPLTHAAAFVAPSSRWTSFAVDSRRSSCTRSYSCSTSSSRGSRSRSSRRKRWRSTEPEYARDAISSSGSSHRESTGSSTRLFSSPPSQPSDAKTDSWRPVRSSIDPTTINVLVSVLFGSKGSSAEATVEQVLDARNMGAEWELTEEEADAVRQRVLGVVEAREELSFTLAVAVQRNPFIEKYFMQGDYGVSDDLDRNPLTQMNHAECLLALFMMHKQGIPAKDIKFLDKEKKEVLSGAK